MSINCEHPETAQIALPTIRPHPTRGGARQGRNMRSLSMEFHQDAVSDDHRFPSRSLGGIVWTFEHLEAFVMHMEVPCEPAPPVVVDVVVLFSNHCFTREAKAGEVVDESRVVMDGRTRRVLDETRYALSRQYLPRLIRELPVRQIRVADPSRPNFVTLELPPAAPGAAPQHYAVFFEVKKDQQRRHRMLLRVQSAYVLDRPARRLLQAEKMRFPVILKRAFGR